MKKLQFIPIFLFSILAFSCKNETVEDPLISNCGTVTDIDGNVYNTVTIGTQCWMAENLRTTRYNNDSLITNVTNNSTWAALRKGAYCVYDLDPGNGATYGKLYNWYAVKTGKLAPVGWHIPTKAELSILITYLGGENIAGGKLKSINLWNSPNSGATNSSGFTGLPSGVRYGDGSFNLIGSDGYFWTSTENTTYSAFECGLSSINSNAYNSALSTVCGLSVRCIKD